MNSPTKIFWIKTDLYGYYLKNRLSQPSGFFNSFGQYCGAIIVIPYNEEADPFFSSFTLPFGRVASSQTRISPLLVKCGGQLPLPGATILVKETIGTLQTLMVFTA